ncbi:MAG TPA: sodium:proton antiporter, partial [Porphyromonadaceae bacterium]|nr:sodium:proton antiporter [Porphyromonadaceae bacterium]
MNLSILLVTGLPIDNPVLKFLLILLIILFAPLLLNRLRIPHLLGLIIAGAIVGPFGFNLMERDSSIILSGTAGLLYIMFLAGLEIDHDDFKKNSRKSLVFGMYTFLIPMTLGIITGVYILQFSLISSVLLASMFASHTLIAYPILSKLGVTRNRAVTITIGGTMITDTLALLVLTVIVEMSKGTVGPSFWIKILISLLIFGSIVLGLFPIIGRWFFKRFNDNVSQYIFVLVIVFTGAFLAELAGIEPIIGAFLSGLSMNRLIPRTSALMNRVEFVGNAIFIPFFLIGVGMLINFRSFVNFETIKVAVVMTIIATLAKFLAAWLTQKQFKYTRDERDIIFGLSNAQAAATLAAVIVGYNVITGTDSNGAPIRLLNEDVLNGTIFMILVTCTIASFAAQRGAKNIALEESADNGDADVMERERILITVSNEETVDDLVQLSASIKQKGKKSRLFALNVISTDDYDDQADKDARKILEKAIIHASATDNRLSDLLRYDTDVVNAITNTIKEQKITYLIMGLHQKKQITESFLGNLTERLLLQSNATTLIFKPMQPLGTVSRYLVIVPDKAEKELGFPFWLHKVWSLAKNTGTKIVFYSSAHTLNQLKEVCSKQSVGTEYKEFENWDNFNTLNAEVKVNDSFLIIMSRKENPSYHPAMNRIHHFLNNQHNKTGFILIYPMQLRVTDNLNRDLVNP